MTIPGNHDYKVSGGAAMIKQVLEETGVRVLTNEAVYPIPDEKRLQLVGVADFSSSEYHPQQAFLSLEQVSQLIGQCAHSVFTSCYVMILPKLKTTTSGSS